MSEKSNQQFEINTRRNVFNTNDYLELKQEVKAIEKKVNDIIDWLINSKSKARVLPINMRKYAIYASKLVPHQEQTLPLVLRKRLLYQNNNG